MLTFLAVAAAVAVPIFLAWTVKHFPARRVHKAPIPEPGTLETFHVAEPVKVEKPVTEPPVEPEEVVEEPKPVYHRNIGYGIDSRDAVQKGWDIHDKMLAVGAEELPEGIRYSFFPVITLNGVRGMKMEYENAVAIKIPGKVNPAVGAVPKDGSVDQNFLIAAGEAYSKFMPVWKARQEAEAKRLEEEEKQRRILEFAKGKPDMLVLGDRQNPVED